MKHYKDLYGVKAGQKAFLDHEEELIDPIAERLIELLDIDLEGSLSDSHGGIVYSNAFDPEVEVHDVSVHFHPNHIIESDGDYWLEENYQEFALLLSIGSEQKDLVESARRKIQAASDLNLTLIRSTYRPNLGSGGGRIVLFSLKPESVGK